MTDHDRDATKDDLNRGGEPLDDVSIRQDDRDVTPPHGDDLRSEATFGRTDRYSNVDDDQADRTEETDSIDDREADAARMDVRRREHSAE